MGRFLNPDNGAFSEAVNSEIYIDKTRLLEYTNRVINTTSKFICNSRPRRFGKSMTADMLSAYYSRGCDSKELFKNYEISTVSSYEKNLNKYDVIHFDVQWCMMDAKDTDHVVDYINEGILPIKKLKTQSALNNFEEFTMLDAGRMAPYVGFTEEEVHGLCEQYGCSYEQVKSWYDGYLLEDYQVYNPKAVVSVMLNGKYKSYWSNTGSYEAIVPLINMDFDGLKSAIIEMLSGASVEVDVTSFQNDTVSFANRDDVLTYLIHLGYLAYDQDSRHVFIPNEEIRHELNHAVKRTRWNEMVTFQKESLALLDATLEKDGKEVAKGIEKIHTGYSSTIMYHDANWLSSVLTIAYLSSMQYYFKPIWELPTGRGFADFVYIPKPEYKADYPALVVELKWNKTADTALQQIKDRKYPQSLEPYTGNILLVGINYDKKTKEHSCVIENDKKQ